MEWGEFFETWIFDVGPDILQKHIGKSHIGGGGNLDHVGERTPDDSIFFQ